MNECIWRESSEYGSSIELLVSLRHKQIYGIHKNELIITTNRFDLNYYNITTYTKIIYQEM